MDPGILFSEAWVSGVASFCRDQTFSARRPRCEFCSSGSGRLFGLIHVSSRHRTRKVDNEIQARRSKLLNHCMAGVVSPQARMKTSPVSRPTPERVGARISRHQLGSALHCHGVWSTILSTLQPESPNPATPRGGILVGFEPFGVWGRTPQSMLRDVHVSRTSLHILSTWRHIEPEN